MNIDNAIAVLKESVSPGENVTALDLRIVLLAMKDPVQTQISEHRKSFEITKIFEELRVIHDVPEPVLESLESLITQRRRTVEEIYNCIEKIDTIEYPSMEDIKKIAFEVHTLIYGEGNK